MEKNGKVRVDKKKIMIKRTQFEIFSAKNGKVRVIEGLENGEFTLKVGKSEVFFVEISKNSKSESYYGLDDWLFLGKRKGFCNQRAFSGKKESLIFEEFFERFGKINEKEVLPEIEK
jgi:hypothetical protein